MNLQSKLNAAQKSFEIWKKVPFSNRQNLLLKLADKLEKNSESLGKIITKEMNKPPKVVDSDSLRKTGDLL